MFDPDRPYHPILNRGPSRLDLVLEIVGLVVVVALAVLGFALFAGCGDNAAAPAPDSGAAIADGKLGPDAGVDAVPADAELLGACADVCPGEELTPWPSDIAPLYWICLPSYKHCSPPPAPPDAASGCSAACAAGKLEADTDCNVVCPYSHVTRCSACPDGPLVCDVTGGICAPAPDCATACDLEHGAQEFCENAFNVCSCVPAIGASFTCVGP